MSDINTFLCVMPQRLLPVFVIVIVIVIISCLINIVIVIIIIISSSSSGSSSSLCVASASTPGIREGTNGVTTNGVAAIFMFFDRGTFWVLPLTFPVFRGSHLSNTTCLTQAFFKNGE